MELKKLIDDLSEALYEAMCEGCWEDDSFTGSVQTQSAEVEAYYYKKGGSWEMEVNVYHNHDYIRDSTNLEKYLADNVEVDWDSVEESWRDSVYDEWQDHGFANERDFWRWKEGR